VRVLVVDPPLFTLPYDLELCRALGQAGSHVELVGRPLRDYEVGSEKGVTLRPLFYRMTDRGGDAWRTSPLTKILKGLEHGAGLLALDRLVARLRPDVVHFQWLVLPLLDRLLLRRLTRGTRLILTVHNSSLGAHSAKVVAGGVAAAAQQVGRRDLVDLFHGFIAHTEQTRAQLEAVGVARRRIRVLAHPPLSVGDLPHATSDGTVRIFFFGSIKPYKGVDVLARAALDLLPSRPRCRIDVVGRPFETLEAERQAIAAAGLEKRFGFDLRYVPDDDLARYLAAADIVVFPYREIDASGAFALAVTAGKPIVASALGVFAEWPASEHIRLVPPGDSSALAAALASLVDDPDARERLGEQVRALRGASVSWSTFAAECVAFYGDRLPAR
jgi:glycosyltransferase involved in cell wall biosynthesis